MEHKAPKLHFPSETTAALQNPSVLVCVQNILSTGERSSFTTTEFFFLKTKKNIFSRATKTYFSIQFS